MAGQDDNERIAKKAHELWEAEGHPHGRDQLHWDEAKEIIAIQDSEQDTLLPRDTGAEEPVEEKSIAIDNEGEAPNLTDTGDHDLTSIDREPAITAPTKAAADLAAAPKKAMPKTVAIAGSTKSEKVPARRSSKKPRGPKA